MVPLCKYLDDIVNIFILFEIIAYFYTTILLLCYIGTLIAYYVSIKLCTFYVSRKVSLEVSVNSRTILT